MSSSPGLTQYASPAIRADVPAVIEVENVVKTFNGRNVLDGVSLTVRRGETLVIMGASGCGKSTLLRCLIGAHKPDGGTIKLFDQNIWKLRTRDLDKVRKRFGILFQSGALFSSMSVGENVALPLKEHTDLSADMIDLMVKVKLELVGLREAEDRLPSEISGGMAKRAGLARAIALDPELLFYDEPTSGLDPIMTSIIDGLITDLARTMNVTSVVVTHDLKSAFRVADRMVVLNNGRIVLQGLPHEIRSSSDPFVRRFIHGAMESRTAMMPRNGSGFVPQPEGAMLVSTSKAPGVAAPDAMESFSSIGQPTPVLPAPFEAEPSKPDFAEASIDNNVEIKVPSSANLDSVAAPDPAPEIKEIPVPEKRDGTRIRPSLGSGFIFRRESEARAEVIPVPQPSELPVQEESQAPGPAAPQEASDELARELNRDHDPLKPQEATQLLPMDTMLIPGMGAPAEKTMLIPGMGGELLEPGKPDKPGAPERKA